MWKRADGELWILVEMRDNQHRELRVYFYIELHYRAGVFDPLMPLPRVVSDDGPGDSTPSTSPRHGRFLRRGLAVANVRSG